MWLRDREREEGLDCALIDPGCGMTILVAMEAARTGAASGDARDWDEASENWNMRVHCDSARGPSVLSLEDKACRTYTEKERT